jgi:hypothetical protein
MTVLVIHVNEKEGRTVSKYGKPKDTDKIGFINDHATKSLEIRVNDPTALCKPGNAPAPVPIVIAPKGRDGYLICNGYTGTEFKYTATLQGLPSEDPIIIVDRYSVGSPNPIIIVGAAALIGGLVLGFLYGRWSGRRALPTP